MSLRTPWGQPRMTSRENILPCNQNSASILVPRGWYHWPPRPSWWDICRNSNQRLRGDIRIGRWLGYSLQWWIQYYSHNFRIHRDLNSRIRLDIDHISGLWHPFCTHIDPSLDHTGCPWRQHCSHRLCNPKKKKKLMHFFALGSLSNTLFQTSIFGLKVNFREYFIISKSADFNQLTRL